MHKLKNNAAKAGRNIIGLSDVTVFLIAVLCAFFNYIFLFAFQTEQIATNIKARIAGIATGLFCFLLILIRWRKFTSLFRVLSCVLLVLTGLFMFLTVRSLFLNLFYYSSPSH